jgi:fatty aldehyde-generating acyl-ACP reductase
MTTSEDPALDFALIGHLETWEKIANVVHALRGENRSLLSLNDIREIVPWIPPRTIVRIKTRSYPSHKEANGVYIDTFITPDNLTVDSYKKNITRVRQAAEYAIRERVRIAALGGFTSIVLEGDTKLLPQNSISFTTGNTLTVAYIVKGVEEAARQMNIDLAECRLLIVGSTGDVGSGCLSYLKGRVRKLYLCARNIRKLKEQHKNMYAHNVWCEYTIDPREYLSEADIVITVASMSAPMFSLEGCKNGALICDAGYPKNIMIENYSSRGINLFYGGMGHVLGGYSFQPDLVNAFYEYPIPYVGHGCMLEGMLLALENRYESFTQGRGKITTEKIEEIWSIAQSHGYVLAPFFNHEGLLTFKHPNKN